MWFEPFSFVDNRCANSNLHRGVPRARPRGRIAAHGEANRRSASGVGLILAYSNALEGLKSTQAALRRLMSEPLITDEPDLGSRAVAIGV